MNNNSFRDKVLSSVIWSTIDKGGVRAINFLIGILIARLLTPSDYGLIGMIMVFISISNLFIDSGISQALIQKKVKSDSDYSTAFIFNVSIAIFFYSILYCSAPYIATFYNEPLLIPLLRILSFNLIIQSFITVPKAKYLIALNFKKQAIGNITGVTGGGILGLIIAYNSLSVWAIVVQQISCQTITVIMYWTLSKWRPSFTFSISSFIELWRFGVKLLGVGLIGTIIKEVNSMVIGKVYRPTELGYYYRAVQTSDMFAYTLNDMINTVTFPILSRVQDDINRFLKVYYTMFEVTAFCIFPILTIISAVGKPLFIYLLTDKWQVAIPLFQWLCIARMFTPLTALNMNILNAKGRPDLVLKLEILKIPIIIIGMIITLPISVTAVVIGNLVTTVFCFLINLIAVKFVFKTKLSGIMKSFIKIIIACIGVFIAISQIMFLEMSNLSLIIVGISIGIILYLALSYILKINTLHTVIDIVKSKLAN